MGYSSFRRLTWGMSTIGLIVLLSYCVGGCGFTPSIPDTSRQTLTTASQQAGDNAKAVAVASTQVTGTAQEVVKDATSGKAATPIALLATLAGYWDRIAANGLILEQQGANLNTISQQLTAVKLQIDLGNKQSEAERTAMQTKLDKVQAKLDAAESATQKLLFWSEMGAIIAGGCLIAWGIYKMDFHLVSAGVVGAIAVVTMCILLGTIDTYKIPILIGMGVVFLGIVAFEVYRYIRPAAVTASPTVGAK